MLPRTSYQGVGPLKPVRSPNLHFPVVIFARTNNRHPPISRSVTQSVFYERPNFSSAAMVARVMQFE
jgi:hypothetical protein